MNIDKKEEKEINWEYKVMPLSYLFFSEEDILNQVAADGWQLVKVIMTEPGSLIVYLKRTRQ
jgi:hypothetical protein